MIRQWLLAVIGAALVWAVQPCAAGSPVSLVAENDHLWRLTYDDAENVTDVRLRQQRVWRAIGRSRGQAEAVCAVGGRLHAFYDGGGYTQYLPGGGSELGGTWPTQWRSYRVLAACKGAGDRYVPDIYLLLAPPIEPATQPATQPTTGPGGGSAVMLVRSKGEWTLAAQVEHDPTGSYHLAFVVGRGPYLLACAADGRPEAMLRFSEGEWAALEAPKLPPGHRARWVLGFEDDLLVAGASDDGAWLRRVDLETGDLGPVVSVARDGAPLVLADDAAAMCPFGLTVAVAWRDGDTWRLGSADLRDGNVTGVEDLSLSATDDITEQPFGQWLEAFMMVVGVIVVVAMLRRFQRGTVAPFSLPSDVQPARWALRLAAALVDMGPFAAAGLGLMRLTPVSFWERLRAMFEANQTDQLVVGAFLITWAGFLLYAVLMEWRVNATLGKLLLKIRVVGSGGVRPTLNSVLLRNFIKPLETIPVPVIAAFFLAWPLFTRCRQRAGDMLAGTAVVVGRPSSADSGIEPPSFDGDDGGPPPPPPPR